MTTAINSENAGRICFTPYFPDCLAVLESDLDDASLGIEQ
jgi:hypothetical protein